MRHSDSRLTSNVYTDASQLQTFHVLPCYDKENENIVQAEFSGSRNQCILPFLSLFLLMGLSQGADYFNLFYILL